MGYYSPHHHNKESCPMQIQTEKKNVALSGEVQSREFTMKAGAHLMSVLSGLYNDPVDAVVREYLTNMYDAYAPLLKAGMAVTPPILRLPTMMNPTLEFQDFGVGMDFDMVWKVYAEYGNSTKSDSNDEVGGFGLGSKTAFCYNNGAPWNIVATKNGETNRFMAFVNERGVPTLTHLSKEATGQPNGVSVSVPIRAKDTEAVRDAAKKYLAYFPMEIVVEGIPKTDMPTLDYVLRGKSWGIRKVENRYSNKTLNVVMGNVPYEVNLNVLFGWSEVANTPALRLLDTNIVDLYVPIGAVDIVPSRDSLKATDRTKQAIKDAAKVVMDEVPEVITALTKSCKNTWERIILAESILDSTDLNEQVTAVLDRKLAIPLPAGVEATGYVINDTYSATPEMIKDAKELHLTARTKGNILTSVVIVNDTKKSCAAEARGYIRQHFVNMGYSGKSARHGHTRCRVYVVTLPDTLSVADFTTKLDGFTNVVLGSALVVPTSTAPKQKKQIPVYQWYHWKYEPNAQVKPNEQVYYYLPLTKGANESRFSFDGGSSGYTFLTELAKAIGVKFSEVYGVRKADADKLDATWVNFQTHVADKVVEYMAKNPALMGRAVAKSENDSAMNFIAKVLPKKVNPTLHASVQAYRTSTGQVADVFRRLMSEELSTYFPKEEAKKITAEKVKITAVNSTEASARKYLDEDATDVVKFAYATWQAANYKNYVEDVLKKALDKTL
jgi:hypothetical protein